MSIRNKLKEREEARDKAAQGAGGGINAGLPDGVTRYVKLGQELKDGKTFVPLAEPDMWFFYYVHEDGDFATRAQHVRKHTCLHSPHAAPASKEESPDLFDKYVKANGAACISCRAKAKRKLYFMLPVFDPQYGTWRVLDLKEFHAGKLIDDYDKLEKAAKKFNKDYTLVGDAVVIRKTSDGKSYSMEAGELDEAALEAARAFIGSTEINYEELANFRDEDDIRAILEAATEGHVDKSVLAAPPVNF